MGYHVKAWGHTCFHCGAINQWPRSECWSTAQDLHLVRCYDCDRVTATSGGRVTRPVGVDDLFWHPALSSQISGEPEDFFNTQGVYDDSWAAFEGLRPSPRFDSTRMSRDISCGECEECTRCHKFRGFEEP